MRTKDVIDWAPLFVAIGAWLTVASQYSQGPMSTALNMTGLVVSLLTLGALFAHFPGEEGEGRESSRADFGQGAGSSAADP